MLCLVLIKELCFAELHTPATLNMPHESLSAHQEPYSQSNLSKFLDLYVNENAKIGQLNNI